jgi:electron transfer flavoprotein alpha subunit
VNIVVCVKVTPIPAEARFDEATKTLVRENVTLTISSLDRRALLEALRLRGEVGGTVTVLSLVPPQARRPLVDTLALGADKVVMLTDPAFAGSDTLATARALSAALRKLDPDLIMCGKFTVDAETGQVPSEVAEMLDLPQVTSIRSVRAADRPDVLTVERETDDGFESYEVTLPALLSVVELITSFRRPSPEEVEAAGAKPIEVWSAADLGIDPAIVGKAGSPTRVAELRSASLERNAIIVANETPEAAARKLMDYLLRNAVFEPKRERAAAKPRRDRPASPDPAKAVWVVAEVIEGGLRHVTFELLGKAQDLADTLGGEVAAVLVGGPDIAKHVPTLGAYGADTVYLASDERLARYQTAAHTEVLASAIRDHKPYAVLLPSTTNGRDWAPRVAARLQLGLTGDAVDLELDENGELAQIKPAFGGNIASPIYSSTSPAMATVRPGMLEARAPRDGIEPKTVTLPTPRVDASRVRLLDSRVVHGLGATRLDDASVIVSIGNGIGGPDNIPVVRELADALDGALAGSLRVSTDRWLPAQLQVGLTGKAVAPRFYIAVGISGQPNHLMGIKRAEHIIAINNNPEAPIFKAANLGVVGDWAEVVPALTAAVREAKKAHASARRD